MTSDSFDSPQQEDQTIKSKQIKSDFAEKSIFNLDSIFKQANNKNQLSLKEEQSQVTYDFLNKQEQNIFMSYCQANQLNPSQEQAWRFKTQVENRKSLILKRLLKRMNNQAEQQDWIINDDVSTDLQMVTQQYKKAQQEVAQNIEQIQNLFTKAVYDYYSYKTKQVITNEIQALLDPLITFYIDSKKQANYFYDLLQRAFYKGSTNQIINIRI